MNLIEFLELHPLLFKHPVLNSFSLKSLSENKKTQSDFRHELCHFLEREIDKAFLPNFGFKEFFKENLLKDNDKYFKIFFQRETRVMILESLCPFDIETNEKIYFSQNSILRLHKDLITFINYRDEQKKNYNSEKWWYLFNEKYLILTKNERKRVSQTSLV